MATYITPYGVSHRVSCGIVLEIFCLSVIYVKTYPTYGEPLIVRTIFKLLIKQGLRKFTYASYFYSSTLNLGSLVHALTFHRFFTDVSEEVSAKVYLNVSKEIPIEVSTEV